jgi:hypothetical protein
MAAGAPTACDPIRSEAMNARVATIHTGTRTTRARKHGGTLSSRRDRRKRHAETNKSIGQTRPISSRACRVLLFVRVFADPTHAALALAVGVAGDDAVLHCSYRGGWWCCCKTHRTAVLREQPLAFKGWLAGSLGRLEFFIVRSRVGWAHKIQTKSSVDLHALGERDRAEPESEVLTARGPHVGTVHDSKTDAWSERKKIYLPVLFVTCSAQPVGVARV